MEKHCQSHLLASRVSFQAKSLVHTFSSESSAINYLNSKTESLAPYRIRYFIIFLVQCGPVIKSQAEFKTEFTISISVTLPQQPNTIIFFHVSDRKVSSMKIIFQQHLFNQVDGRYGTNFSQRLKAVRFMSTRYHIRLKVIYLFRTNPRRKQWQIASSQSSCNFT